MTKLYQSAQAAGDPNGATGDGGASTGAGFDGDPDIK